MLLGPSQEEQSAFGMTTRECTRAQRKLRRLSLWCRSQNMTMHEKAEEVARSTGNEANINEAISAAKTLQLLDSQQRRAMELEHQTTDE